MDGEDLTVPEIAESLGISKDAVRKAIKRGTMPSRFVKGGPRGGGTLGGFYAVTKADVERYREEHAGRVLGRPKPTA